jgi:hypothetical protein
MDEKGGACCGSPNTRNITGAIKSKLQACERQASRKRNENRIQNFSRKKPEEETLTGGPTRKQENSNETAAYGQQVQLRY